MKNAIFPSTRYAVKAVVELEATDGRWYSIYGAPAFVQWTGEKRILGYVLFDAQSNTTYGQRYATREAAQQRVDDANVQDAQNRAAWARSAQETKAREDAAAKAEGGRLREQIANKSAVIGTIEVEGITLKLQAKKNKADSLILSVTEANQPGSKWERIGTVAFNATVQNVKDYLSTILVKDAALQLTI